MDNINIDDLTIRQAKELMSTLNLEFSQPNQNITSDITSDIIGGYVLVRSENEGLNCGVVKDASSSGITLTEARRLWYHRPLDETMSWYEGVSISGLALDSKISEAVSQKIIIEDYSVVVCTKEAEKSLRGFVGHEQKR